MLAHNWQNVVIRNHDDFLRLVAAHPELQQPRARASQTEQQLNHQIAQLNAQLGDAAYSIDNNYRIQLESINGIKRIVIRESSSNPPNEAAQRRFTQFWLNHFSGKYVAILGRQSIRNDDGIIKVSTWTLYPSEQSRSDLISLFKSSFSHTLKKFIDQSESTPFLQTMESKRLGDSFASVLSGVNPHIPVCLPGEEDNMYDLIDLLKLCPNREGRRISPCTREPFQLDEIKPHPDFRQLKERYDLLNATEARYGIRPISISRKENYYDVTLPNDEGSIGVTFEEINTLNANNKQILREFEKELKTYETHLYSWKTQLLFKFNILSSPSDKIIAMELLKKSIPQNAQATDAEKIIFLRKILTEDIAATLCSRRDGWGSYFLKCIATLLSLSTAHYIWKIFASHGEVLSAAINPRECKLNQEKKCTL